MSRILLLSVAVQLAISTQGMSEEAPVKADPAKIYRGLIQQLASSNKRPTTNNRGGGPSVTFPEGYDVKLQQQIDVARRKLSDDFEKALPYLIDALEDKRYSMSIDWAGVAFYNYSVGDVCRDIIDSHLEVYREVIGFVGPQHWNDYNYRMVSKDWFEIRKAHTLDQLQIEAIDWALKLRLAETDRYHRDDRKNEVDDLKRLREQIFKSGKSAKPSALQPMVTSNQAR